MNAKSRILLVVLSLMAVMTLAGCGANHCATNTLTQSGSGGSGNVNTGGTVCGSGTTGGGPSAAFVFYLDNTAVQTGSVGTNGTFTTLTGITPATPSGSVIDDMAVVNQKFLYLPFGDINAVQALTVNSNGSLSTVTGSPFALTALGSTDAVVSDPQGRFLFVGGEGTGLISVFQINSTTGALTEAPGSPFNYGLISADSMAVDGNGKFLYVGQLSISSPVAAFSIDQNTGSIAPIVGSPFALGVAQLHADPSGKYLLGVADIADNPGLVSDPHLFVFAIDQTTGTPTAVAGSPFATTAAPFDFAISPNGKFVYTTGVTVGTSTVAPIEGYQLDNATGTITTIATSPFSSSPAANQCRFDQSGGLLICDSVNGLTVENANVSTGALTHGADLNASFFAFAWAVTD